LRFEEFAGWLVDQPEEVQVATVAVLKEFGPQLGRLTIEQTAFSKLERRADIYVSNLRKYIRAMRGFLEIIANFPGHDPVIIGQVIKTARRGRRPRVRRDPKTVK
jgi:hypothetical protein